MANVEIGLGTVISGTFADIDWAANEFFCKIEIDLLNGQGFELAGVSQFLSVPYALVAGKAETVEYVDYSQIINVPVLFSGNYDDLIGAPDFTNWDTDVTNDFTGSFNNLTDVPSSILNIPDFTNWDTDVTNDFTGSFNNLTDVPSSILNIPDFTNWDTDLTNDFTGSFNNLTDVPSSILNIPDFTNWDTDVTNDFTGSFNNLTDVPSSILNIPDFTNWDTDVTDDFSGSYLNLTNVPIFSTVATTGSYTDLLNKPTLFSGSYTDLTNKPINATTLQAGFMSSSDKVKIDGLQNANLIAGTGISLSGTYPNITITNTTSGSSYYVGQLLGTNGLDGVVFYVDNI